MSATTTPTTFSDLYTDVLNRVRANTSDSTSIQIAKRLLNQGNHDLHFTRDWPWSERHATLKTHATYSTGTVAIATSARTTVTGTSTLWATAVTGFGFNNARAGGKMLFEGSVEPYTVQTVSSDTSITLADRWIGDALTAATYVYYEDEYALESDFARLADARFFSDVLRLPVIERRQFYTHFPKNTHRGRPQVVSIIDRPPSSSTAPQPRLLVHPAPDQVYNIPYRYITANLAVSSAGTGAANMSDDTDEPIIPVRYRHVLVQYAIAHWYRDRKDDERFIAANAEYVDTVKRMGADLAPETDHARLIPRRFNRMGGVRWGAHRFGSRFDVGGRFDEMRD